MFDSNDPTIKQTQSLPPTFYLSLAPQAQQDYLWEIDDLLDPQKEPLVLNDTLLSECETIHKFAEWNEQAIQGADKFTGDCCLIEGPSGAG